LEITESALMRDAVSALEVRRALKSLGVALAIDDFGTGYSSLSYLQRFPLDVLKIDRVFVDSIATDPTDQAIVETIVRLARAFELDVVGEGVENPEDMDTLVRLGCERAQGFLLSHTTPPDLIEPIIEAGGIDLRAVASKQAHAAAS
jgi:EAL domain-containing protein (putative c-di-GMP-specific phosphodiesterase class I)